MPPQTLILSIPGTQDTREMELDAVKHGVARGEIGLDNWVWSPAQNDWLPLAQLPEFAVPVVPTAVTAANLHAVRVVTPVAVPVVRGTRALQVGQGASSQVASATGNAAVPAQVPVPGVSAVQPGGATGLAATYYSTPVAEHHEFPIFKILFVVLGVLIAGLVGVNYFKVEQPFRQGLSQTAFATLPAHAHLGAFVQPNALLIHIFPNDQITSDNFADVLMALTRSAPREVFSGHPFATVGLTSSWRAEYVIPDENWNGFMDMSGFSQDQKREYVLTHLETSTGEELVPPVRKESPDEHRARETKIWNDLVAHFRGRSPSA